MLPLFIRAWHTFHMHMDQIRHLVQEVLANPVVHGVLIGSGIFGAVRNIGIVLKACGQFLFLIRETVLALWGLVAIIRSPDRLVEGLVSSWLAGGRTLLPQRRQLLEPLMPFVACLFIFAGTAYLICCSCGRTRA